MSSQEVEENIDNISSFISACQEPSEDEDITDVDDLLGYSDDEREPTPSGRRGIYLIMNINGNIYLCVYILYCNKKICLMFNFFFN